MPFLDASRISSPVEGEFNCFIGHVGVEFESADMIHDVFMCVFGACHVFVLMAGLGVNLHALKSSHDGSESFCDNGSDHRGSAPRSISLALNYPVSKSSLLRYVEDQMHASASSIQALSLSLGAMYM